MFGVPFLRENQDAGVRVTVERRQQDVVGAKKLRDVAGWTIADSQKNELGRMAKDQAALMKVGILGDDGVTLLLGEGPDQNVIGVDETVRLDKRRVGIEVQKLRDDSLGQVLIEKELHAAALKSLRSRSAANDRHALMSSRVSSEKSVRISSSVMPEARYSNTS